MVSRTGNQQQLALNWRTGGACESVGLNTAVQAGQPAGAVARRASGAAPKAISWCAAASTSAASSADRPRNAGRVVAPDAGGLARNFLPIALLLALPVLRPPILIFILCDAFPRALVCDAMTHAQALVLRLRVQARRQGRRRRR